jgi:tetratricopeptide (TPR) repeat protein
MKNLEAKLWQEKLARLESARRLTTDEEIKLQLDDEIQKGKRYIEGLEDTRDRSSSELQSSSANPDDPQVSSLLNTWDEYKKQNQLPHFFKLREYGPKSEVQKQDLLKLLNNCIQQGASVESFINRESLQKLAREISEYINRLYYEYPKNQISPYHQVEQTLSLPYEKNYDFIGRFAETNTIHIIFQENKCTNIVTVTLSGMGGIGKTQIALEYAYRYRKYYTGGIYWLQSDSLELFLLSIKELADELIPDQSQNINELDILARILKKHLENQSKWLLIIDNADDLSICREYLPSKGNGCILITTRLSDNVIDPQWNTIVIKSFSNSDSNQFLQKRVKQEYESDPEGAKQLIDKLGRLPLALDQAVGYIVENKLTFRQYLEKYKDIEEGKKLREAVGFLSGEHVSVYTTYLMALEQTVANFFVAVELIRICAFLHNETIQEVLFTENPAIWGNELAQQLKKPLGFSELCSHVTRYSLMQWNAQKKFLIIHPVVQQVIRGELSPDKQKEYLEKAIIALNSIYPEEEQINFGLRDILNESIRDILNESSRLFPHVYNIFNWVNSYEIILPELARLIYKAGCYLMIICQYENAEQFYNLALEISRKIHNANPTEQTELPVANSLNNLAELKEIQSLYQDAKSKFEEALEIRVRCLDEDNYLIGQSKHNLGRLNFHLGQYSEAYKLYQEALQINLANIDIVKHRKNTFRKETLNALLARSYNDIAKLYFTQADYDLAEKNYLEAQKINEKRLGKTHPHYASNLDNLGDVYLAQGLSDQAESCYSQALEIRRNYLRGEDFNAIADSYTRLGRLYLVLQDFKKSQDYYEKVLRIRCKIFGEQHPSVANSYNNLALLYQEQNNTTEASKYYAQALKIYHNKKSKYQNHPSLSSLYYNIAIFRHNQEQLVKAEKYYHKSLQLYQSIFGETHPLATNCYYNLSLLYSELERYEDVAKYLVKLGDCEYEIERLDKAAICYSKAIAIYKEELSEQCTLELLDTLDKLALLYQDQGKYKEAESHFQEALQIWQEILEDKEKTKI